MRREILIIGAGPGGLAAAMLLADSGARVRVLERRDVIGGRTSRLRIGGYSFDLGPTFFLYPQALQSVFAACGRDLRDEVRIVRLDPQYHLRFSDGSGIAATPDRERMREEIARLDPRDARRLDDFLDDNRRKFAAFAPVLQRPFASAWQLLAPDVLRALPLLRPWASVDRDLRRYFRDPRVRLAFTFQSKYLGMSPFRCPSLFSILSFLEHEYGVFHPLGGCAALTEAMARVAADAGVEIHLGCEVDELLFEERRCVGARADGETWRADAVVINADFADAMQRLVPDRLRRRWTDRRIARKRFSCSTFMLYLGIDGQCDALPHHSIHLAEDYCRNLEDIERRHVVGDDCSVYIHNPVAHDPSVAPDGHAAVYMLAPVTHCHPNVDWEREAPALRDRLLGRLRTAIGAEVADRIRAEHVVTPETWRDVLRVHRGATFSLAHTYRQMLHLRPNNRFEDLGGIYLVGGGTHPGSGLPVIIESARISSRLLAADLGLTLPWIARDRALQPRLREAA